MEPIRIAGVSPFQSVYVATLDDTVWVNVMHGNGNSNIQLSVEGAEKLIAALQSSISNVGATLDVRHQNEPVEASE